MKYSVLLGAASAAGLRGSEQASDGSVPRFVENFDDLENWVLEIVSEPHNGELQYYTDRSENIRIEDGILKIRPLKEDYEGRKYTSGRMYSKFIQKYGRVELKAKQPKGYGLWPALWMMPNPYQLDGTADDVWPRAGEIDIFEGRGQHPDQVESTIHFGADRNRHDYIGSGARKVNCDHSEQFHTFQLDWTPTELVYSFDGTPYYRHNLNRFIQENEFYNNKGDPFHNEFYVVLNIAIGGWFLDGPDEDTVWSYPEAELWVDSIKMYDLEEVTDSVTCSADEEASVDDLCFAATAICVPGEMPFGLAESCESAMKACDTSTTKKDDLVEIISQVFADYDEGKLVNECAFFGADGETNIGYVRNNLKIGTYKSPPSGTCIAKSSDEIDPSSHCGNLNWACGPDNQWADVSTECAQRTTWECCDVDSSTCSEYDLVKEGNSIYDAYYQQMVVSGPDEGACNFGGSAKIVSDCLALPGSSARFVCSEILTVCGSGINDIFVNQACSSAESLTCCISDYNTCNEETLISESSAIYTAWANALNHPAGVCDFSGTARYAHEQLTPCA